MLASSLRVRVFFSRSTVLIVPVTFSRLVIVVLGVTLSVLGEGGVAGLTDGSALE
jgi:hypothetical protein